MKINYYTFLLLFIVNAVQAQLVTTVAGQVEVTGATDGAPFDATFNNPHGIAVDANGIVYVADRWSHTIRKVDLDGTVSTIAGQPGISGAVDGEGQSATFNEPWGLCVDFAGNIFVADTRNNKIRKITPEGIVTTIAGTGSFGTSNGPGRSATFGNPTGIESDENGILYIADHLTHIIRKIDTNGNVSTIAGRPYQEGHADGQGNQATFRRPYGLTLDNNGDILVADEWNHKIRKVTPEGLVSTIAGTREIGNRDGNAAGATFNYPWDLTVDEQGNIFVADGYNYTIRKITESGLVYTYAGTVEVSGATNGEGTEATFSGATAIAFSPLTKELYVGDAYNNLIRKITSLDQDVSIALLVGDTLICPGEYIQIIANPNIYNEYHFYQNDELVQSGTNSVFESDQLPSGMHEFQVIATKSTGESSSSNVISINVHTVEVPTITLVGDSDFFEGDSVILISSFGSAYFWSTGDTDPRITVTESGSYHVEVIDQNGCSEVSAPVEIRVEPLPEKVRISVLGDSVICANEFTELRSNYGENNQWLKDGWPINGETDSILMVSNYGVYQVRVTLPSGDVTISDPVTINVLPVFDLEISVSDTTGNPNDTFQFSVLNTDVSAVSWNFGDGQTSSTPNPVHSYSQEGIYTVGLMATNEQGCRDTLLLNDLMVIEAEDNNGGNNGGSNGGNNGNTGNGGPTVNAPGGDIFIPTAFTPNDDGQNDVLLVRSNTIENIDFLVFNQWGEQVFQSASISNGWDGEVGGANAQSGNYVYVIKYVDRSGVTRNLSGRVTLLR